MDRFEPQLVTIFGGAGFVGTQLVQLLAQKGYRIRIAVRRPDLAGHTRTLGTVGQITPIQANLRNVASVQRAVKGADIVINLVAVGFERGAQTFTAVNTKGAANVAAAARDAGVKALVHMSALGVDIATTSLYARSKLAGEAEVLKAFPQAVIIRPSILFGRDDGFFNLMGSLARILPVMPLIGGDSRFQPAYVGDVAEAIAMAAEGQVKAGRIYELGGPEIETHKALLTRILREAGRDRPLLPLSAGIAKLLALPFAILPFKPLLTADQIELLGTDNVVSDAAIRDKRTFAAFGITPTAMDAILPSYMWRFRKNGQFDRAEVSPSA
ncbi:MAG TPA: complex I NDUFA9 subunit family protein [Devosia sp.]|nr:complex I NDUFA9 subunit family protein [Devosia sp.]